MEIPYDPRDVIMELNQPKGDKLGCSKEDQPTIAEEPSVTDWVFIVLMYVGLHLLEESMKVGVDNDLLEKDR